MSLLSKERRWPTLITLALLGNVALGFVLIRVARGDEHFAVEPNYYRKAVEWDSTAAQAERNRALGWQITAQLGAVTPGTEPTMQLAVRTGTGESISGAVVTLEAMPVAYAGEMVTAQLPATDSLGQTAAAVALHRTGLWELRVSALRGADRFTANLRLDVSASRDAILVTERPGDPRP
jgi:nitrogen fixation protein FixH